MVNVTEILSLREAGLTQCAIAARIGVSRQRIGQILEAAGVPKSGPARSEAYRTGELERAVERYCSGPWKSVASAAGGKLPEDTLRLELTRRNLIRARPLPEHGTIYRYEVGCRCPKCRARNVVKTKRNRERRRGIGQCFNCRRKAKRGHVLCDVHLAAMADYNRRRVAPVLAAANH